MAESRTARTSFAPPPGEAASFRYRDKGYHQVFGLSAHHVAKGGVLIATLSPLERSRTLTFEMRTTEGRTLEGVCVVVRSREAVASGAQANGRPPGMVVRFIHFDDPDAARTVLASLVAAEDVSERDKSVLARLIEHCNLRPSAEIEDELSMGDVPPPAPSSPDVPQPMIADSPRRLPSRRTIAAASAIAVLAVLGIATLVATGTPRNPDPSRGEPAREGRPPALPKPDPTPARTVPAPRQSSPSLPSPSELENGPDGKPAPRPAVPQGPAPAVGADPYDTPSRPPPAAKPPSSEPYD